MNASCPYYRFSATTFKSPHPPEELLHRPVARLIEWCEHPLSVFPRKETSQILPCAGDLKKCSLFPGGDRRKYPRFYNALPVEYRQTDNRKIRLGYTSNIGEGGLMVSLPEKMGVGERLRLKIFFTSGRHLKTLDDIEVTGKVIWVNPDLEKIGYYRVGMKFEGISPEDVERLRRFLNLFGVRY